ncbi:MAG: hypothetical protein AVDCRST_MAG40-974, partial [uncultured Gemmatimonadaceae bacterium]
CASPSPGSCSARHRQSGSAPPTSPGSPARGRAAWRGSRS